MLTIHYFEIGVILLVALIQIYFFVVCSRAIRRYKSVFEKPLSVAEHSLESESLDRTIHFLESESENETNIKVKQAINDYLSSNAGSTINFAIIRDIIERELKAINEQIEQFIPVPLYLGLSATIVGIIFGLFSMPEFGVSVSPSLNGIDSLITGVKIAMFASLTGLLWTVILSSFIYRGAQVVVNQRKNSQLNYLQEKLLPILISYEDTGVISLKESVDAFSRDSKSIVEKLSQVTQITQENILQQNETIKQIENIDLNKLQKFNIEVFKSLEDNIGHLKSFNKYINKLAKASENLEHFATSTESIHEIADEIKATLNQSHKLTQFLTSHLDKLEDVSDLALHSFDLSQSNIAKAVEVLHTTTNDKLDSIGQVSDNLEEKFSAIYEELFNRVDKIANSHIEAFEKNYSDSTPEFKQLNHLAQLEGISSQLKHLLNGNSVSGEDKEHQHAMLSVRDTNRKLDDITKILVRLLNNSEKQKESFFDVLRWSSLKEWYRSKVMR